MIANLRQPAMSLRTIDNPTGEMSRDAVPRGVSASWTPPSPTMRQQRTIGRRELLGTGLAGVLVALMPAGLAQAAASGTSSRVSGVTGLPASALLEGYPQLYQQHALSCEAAAASMATRGRVSEQQILDQMPHNSNPWLGFRGNVDGGQSLADGLADYGIYAPPLARELQRFGYQTQVIAGTAAPALLRHSIGVLHRPVEVWVTHYLGDYPALTGYAGGRSFTLINGEHARLAIGYDAYGIHTLDPLDGPRYDSWATFLASWSRFDHMGITVGTAG